jgi:predicted dehydrogenase
MPVKLTAAIVGCGQIAGGYDERSPDEHVLTHAKAYTRHPATQLVAVADIDAAKAERFARLWGVPKIFSNCRQMLEEVRPDLLSICTPDDDHAGRLEECLSFPVRGVWCEKPIATDETAADRLVTAYEERGIPLAVNYMRRWDSALQRVGRAFRAGGFQQAIVLYGKGLRHSGSHAVDLLMDWFGAVREVYALSAVTDFVPTDPTVSVWLKFENGFEAYLIGRAERHYSLWEIDILGESSRIRITQAGARVETYSVRDDPVFKDYRELEPAPVISETDLFFDTYLALDNIVAAVLKGEALHSSGRTALETLKVCNHILRSAATLIS